MLKLQTRLLYDALYGSHWQILFRMRDGNQTRPRGVLEVPMISDYSYAKPAVIVEHFNELPLGHFTGTNTFGTVQDRQTLPFVKASMPMAEQPVMTSQNLCT